MFSFISQVAELRERLKLKGLNSVGNKQELIERLQSAADSSGVIDEDDLLNVRRTQTKFSIEISKISETFQDDELEEEKSLLDSTHDEMLKSPSDSAKSTSPEVTTAVAAKPISLKRNISVTVPVSETKSEEVQEVESSSDSASAVGEPNKKVVKISELSAKERLELRAKKFAGSASAASASSAAAVTTSTDSQEKLQARAARFGITAPTATADSSTKTVSSSVNLEVLKKRAERFGVVTVPELKKSELDEKLTKRQERFGAAEKTPITGPTTAKSEYEEKALKRLERFKQTA